MDVVFEELSGVHRSVSPQELASSVLLSIAVLTLVTSIIRPDLLTIAMLLILEPVSFVAGTIGVVILTVPMGLVVLPFAIVHITIGVNQSASTICFVRLPISFIKTAVDPDLNALAIFAAELVPLALILGTIVESHERPLNSHNIIGWWAWFEIERLQLVTNLHHQLACLEYLLVGLRVGGHGKCGVLRLEAILSFDQFTRHEASEVALHREDGILLTLLRIILALLSTYTLCLMCVKLCVIGFGPTTSLSHICSLL